MFPIDLNRVHSFLRIVELGNITRAAKAMSEPKAKLSRNLALLEQDLGVQLVHRTTRQFQLTAAGAEFYQNMKGHFTQMEAAVLGLSKREEAMEGRIRVTAPEDIGNLIVTPIVNEFATLYGGVQFDLVYTNQVLDMVKMGIDVAIRAGRLRDSSMVHRKVGTIDLILVASPKYLQWSPPIEKPEDLTQHSLIAFLTKDRVSWNLQSDQGRRSVKISPKFSVNSFVAVCEICRLGQGVALLPSFLADKLLAKGELVRVLKSWWHEGDPLQVAMPQQKNVSRRNRAFFDFAVSRLNGLLDG